jgi:glycosyltransferase involved in cell wall biosynthesis
MIPPNSLAFQAKKYRKNHKKTKIIFDLMDLWPETLPISRFESNPLFSIWRELRDRNLKSSDLILTECDLYRQVLAKQLNGLIVSTLHLAKSEALFPLKAVPSVDTLHLCYLGSINNIIDIPAICLLVFALRNIKPVVVHIIGDGESCSLFVESLAKNGAKVVYEGAIYDSIEKQTIFDSCHFGLNIMKESTVIGLTIKSIDYFHAGLPLINSIPSDTKTLILENNAGFQFERDKVEEFARTLCKLTQEQIQDMRVNARNVFVKEFSIEAFERSFNVAFEFIE